MNSIGRASDERVALDFDDELISRKGHAIVTYDPKGRKFYIQHGGGYESYLLGRHARATTHTIKRTRNYLYW